MKDTLILSRFIANTRFRDFPPQAINQAKIQILDTIGSAFYSSDREWSRIILAYARQNIVQGKATILTTTDKTSPAMAALVNGTMAHGFEIDDTHVPSNSHPGSVVIPAALSVGEANRCSGKKFICAIILGYEAMGRIGKAVGTNHTLRGFHPTGTNGVFGSTVAAGKILKLGADKMASALGIAGSMATGIKEFSVKGEMVKRLHAGCASERGIVSAYLAKTGLTGPKTILEGRFGYLNVYSDKPDLSEITQNLGNSYEINYTDIKPYACCRSIQPAIQALEEIQLEHRIDPEKIKEIVVAGSKKMVAQNSGEGRDSIMAAQYSVPFAGALSFFRDLKDPDSFDESALKDKKIINLSKKFKTIVDPDLHKKSKKGRAARVTVRLTNQKTLSGTVLSAKGHPSNPLSLTEIKDKFIRLSSRVFKEQRLMDIMDRVENLEKLNDINQFIRFLSEGIITVNN
jgi:2-methylcitrate dehydratase PrpD